MAQRSIALYRPPLKTTFIRRAGRCLISLLCSLNEHLQEVLHFYHSCSIAQNLQVNSALSTFINCIIVIEICMSSRYIKELMSEAGLKISVDAVGNTYGLWEGSDPSLGKDILILLLCQPSPSDLMNVICGISLVILVFWGSCPSSQPSEIKEQIEYLHRPQMSDICRHPLKRQEVCYHETCHR